MDAEEIFASFDEVYEIFPGRLYELVDGMEKFRMIISKSIVGPGDIRVTFDQLVSVAYNRAASFFEGANQTPQLWSPIADCVVTSSRGTPENAVLSMSAFSFRNWLDARTKRET